MVTKVKVYKSPNKVFKDLSNKLNKTEMKRLKSKLALRTPK